MKAELAYYLRKRNKGYFVHKSCAALKNFKS